MSETTEDKTKRKYLAVFKGNPWSNQYSVFYADPTMSNSLLDDMVAFKQRLRRVYPDQPFLIRIQLKSGSGWPLHAYLTMFTTKPVDGLQDLVSQLFTTPMKVLSRRLNEGKMVTIANAIDKQRPQNLSKFFAKAGVNRWTVLNKGLLVEV
ncbi:hypothetical protein D3C77_363420 [compost metagenome]